MGTLTTIDSLHMLARERNAMRSEYLAIHTEAPRELHRLAALSRGLLAGITLRVVGRRTYVIRDGHVARVTDTGATQHA